MVANNKGRKRLRRLRSIGLILTAFAVVFLAFYSGNPEQEPTGLMPAGRAICILTDLEIKNQSIATLYGVRGYVEFNPAANTPKTMTIGKGEEAHIVILVHFVSYDPRLTEVHVKFDPAGSEGLSIERHYTAIDENGATVKRVLRANDLVSYDVPRVISVTEGKTLKVTMTVRSPAEYPSKLDFRLSVLGVEVIEPYVAVCNHIAVKVNANA